ncbi:hypothetical protein Bbelb_222050 [Branchiostoma belcheri]|nr:hypothetical protein Bbelb_222050 [Branchiostoma belcheri]
MKTVLAVCCLLLSLCSEFRAAGAFTPFSYFSRLAASRPGRGGPMDRVAWGGGKSNSALEYLGPRLRKSDQADLPAFPCHNSEWLIYVDEESQCVPPLYDTAYDDEYCIKVDMGPLAGRVVCACERGATTVAMKDGMDTCVEIDVVRQVGYCGLNPCPGGYTCQELPVSGRFNCVKQTPKGEVVVPNWSHTGETGAGTAMVAYG